MKKLAISYNDFKKNIDAIKYTQELQESISSAIRTFNIKGKDSAELFLPNLSSHIVKLLSILTKDEGQWIDYWVFELECGKEYSDGLITDKDGKNIKLRTVDDLWNLLLED